MRAANRLAKLKFSRGITSDRKRTKQTAAILKKVLGVDFTYSHKLRALNVGDFSGKEKTPERQKEMAHYVSHPSETIPGGESLNHFKARVRPVLQKLFIAGRKLPSPILLVGHSSIIHEIGSMIYKDHNSILVEPGGIASVTLKDGKLTAKAVYKASPPKGKQEVS